MLWLKDARDGVILVLFMVCAFVLAGGAVETGKRLADWVAQ